MSLDEGVSRLIGDIYAGAHDHGAWDRAIQGLRARTHTYCAEVAILDLRRRDRASDRFYGPDEPRLRNGVRDYHTEFERLNICFPFSERHRPLGSSHRGSPRPRPRSTTRTTRSPDG